MQSRWRTVIFLFIFLFFIFYLFFLFIFFLSNLSKSKMAARSRAMGSPGCWSRYNNNNKTAPLVKSPMMVGRVKIGVTI
jgi:hypothetical protein